MSESESTNGKVKFHEPNLEAKPAKSALVTNKRVKMKKQVHLTWDENAIEEHDQLRGTRMKIDEPNTPFSYEQHSDTESVGSQHSRDQQSKQHQQLDWSHLENKLAAAAAAQEACPSSPSPSASSQGGNSSGVDSDAELERKRRKLKAKEFEMHRKSHYNEMEAMKKWRAEHADNDDEDDDDDLNNT